MHTRHGCTLINKNIFRHFYSQHFNMGILCLCDIAVSLLVGNPTSYKGAEHMPALSFCPHLLCLLPCLSVHGRLSIPRSALLFECPAPTAARAPRTTTITAVLPKNKRESVRHHPLDLFHTRAPTSVPDGVCLFFRVSLNPKSPPKWSPPLSGAHYSAARHPPAPPPRAHGQGTSPLYPTTPGSPIKVINHFLLGVCFQAFRISLPAV